jgi:hypothetical protein
MDFVNNIHLSVPGLKEEAVQLSIARKEENRANKELAGDRAAKIDL